MHLSTLYVRHGLGFRLGCQGKVTFFHQKEFKVIIEVTPSWVSNLLAQIDILLI